MYGNNPDGLAYTGAGLTIAGLTFASLSVAVTAAVVLLFGVSLLVVARRSRSAR